MKRHRELPVDTAERSDQKYCERFEPDYTRGLNPQQVQMRQQQGLILFILFFIIAIIVFGLSIVGFLLRTIFGIGRRSSSSHHGKTGQSQQSYNQGSYNSNDDEEEILSENTSARKHKKIFNQDDGE